MIKNNHTYFLLVEDFVRAAIGPFYSLQDVMNHINHVLTPRGDSGSIIGIYPEGSPECDGALAKCGVNITPREDRNSQVV